jgi:hypothetical protein
VSHWRPFEATLSWLPWALGRLYLPLLFAVVAAPGLVNVLRADRIDWPTLAGTLVGAAFWMAMWPVRVRSRAKWGGRIRWSQLPVLASCWATGVLPSDPQLVRVILRDLEYRRSRAEHYLWGLPVVAGLLPLVGCLIVAASVRQPAVLMLLPVLPWIYYEVGPRQRAELARVAVFERYAARAENHPVPERA